MGAFVDPALLTESGERCIRRLTELGELRLPPAQFITALGTAVEVHVSRVLATLVVLSGVQESKLGDAMLQKIELDMTRTWHDRKEWLSTGFGIVYTGFKPYQDFNILVELRNSVVHGDGAASDQQQRKSVADLRRLRQDFLGTLEVRFYGQAKFGTKTNEMAMDIARRFVLDFDQRVLALYPEARRL